MKLDFDVHQDVVVNAEPNNIPKTIIASSYNLPKMLVSFIQAIWAVTTIYRTRGDQIQQYGYAAFGLTVAPYATMSILNTLANMFTPDYPSMFLIRTPVMDKAEREGEGFFKGAIRLKLQDVNPLGEMQGRRISSAIVSMDDNPFLANLNVEPSSLNICVAFLCSLIPLGIVGGLSGFQTGNSSQMERGFTMSWLVVGIIYGLTFGLGDLSILMQFMTMNGRKNKLGSTLRLYFTILLGLGVPSIGGMVVVGMMIRNFGICTLIG